ncbi:MAG: hypothetical protein WEB04_12685 [Dehalococcoidia bacterium]
MKFLTICAFTVVLTIAALGAACSDDGGGKTLTLDEYFQQLDAIQNENDATFATQEASAEEPAEDASGEELAAFLRDSVTESADTLRDTGSKGGDLEPPDEVADAHDDIVAAINTAADALDAAADDVPDTLTIEELADGTFFDDEALNAAFDGITTACNALEAIATENNITVDLACDEG